MKKIGHCCFLLLLLAVILFTSIDASADCATSCQLPKFVSVPSSATLDQSIIRARCLSLCASTEAAMVDQNNIMFTPWPVILNAFATDFIPTCFFSCTTPSTMTPMESCNGSTNLDACLLGFNALNASNVRPATPIAPATYLPMGIGEVGYNFNPNGTAPSSIGTNSSVIYSYLVKLTTPATNTTSYFWLINLNNPVFVTDAAHYCNESFWSFAVGNKDGISEFSSLTRQCMGLPRIVDMRVCYGFDLRLGYDDFLYSYLTWDIAPDSAVNGYEASLLHLNFSTQNKYQVFQSENSSDELILANNQIPYFYEVEIERSTTPGTLTSRNIRLQDHCLRKLPHFNASIAKVTRLPDCTYSITINSLIGYDPIALRKLQLIKVHLTENSPSTNPFRYGIFPTNSHNTSTLVVPDYPEIKNYTCQCERNYTHYTCEEACSNMGHSGNEYIDCVSSCVNVTTYSITYSNPVEPGNYTIFVDPDEKDGELIHGGLLAVELNINLEVCIVPLPLNVKFATIVFKEKEFSANISWEPPIDTYQHDIIKYIVYIGQEGEERIGTEFVDINDATKYTIVGPPQTWMVVNHSVLPGENLIIQVRAVVTDLGDGVWSDAVVIPSPVTTSGSEDVCVVCYVVGFLVPALVIAIICIIVFIICYRRSHGIKYASHNDPPPYSENWPEIAEELPVDDWEISPESVELQEKLGSGNFGEVYKALVYGFRTDGSADLAAVKVLKADADSSMKMEFLQEIRMMKQVSQGKNPHVVNMIACCTTQEPLALILELATKGNLLDYLKLNRADQSRDRTRSYVYTNCKKQDKLLKPAMALYENQEKNTRSNDYVEQPGRGASSETPVFAAFDPYASLGTLESADVIQFAWQIASGMSYLQSLKLIHRDLACRNVLVGEQKRLKLSDFGLARSLSYCPVYTKDTDGKLPLRWMAIESIVDRTYTHQSDVWSFGITLWEMCTLGGYPYPTLGNGDILQFLMEGKRLDCPANCSEELYKIMLSCWEHIPEDRPTFAQLEKELDIMLTDQQNNQYIKINAFNEPYIDMYPTQDEDTASTTPDHEDSFVKQTLQDMQQNWSHQDPSNEDYQETDV